MCTSSSAHSVVERLWCASAFRLCVTVDGVSSTMVLNPLAVSVKHHQYLVIFFKCLNLCQQNATLTEPSIAMVIVDYGAIRNITKAINARKVCKFKRHEACERGIL